MAESTEIEVPGTGRPLTLLRPLLPVTRAEIDHYVKLEKIKFREDASNESMAPVRNRMRHEVLPLLQETMGRNIRPALLRAASIAAEEDDYLKWLAAPWASHERLPVKVIQQEAPAMQRP